MAKYRSLEAANWLAERSDPRTNAAKNRAERIYRRAEADICRAKYAAREKNRSKTGTERLHGRAKRAIGDIFRHYRNAGAGNSAARHIYLPIEADNLSENAPKRREMGRFRGAKAIYMKAEYDNSRADRIIARADRFAPSANSTDASAKGAMSRAERLYLPTGASIRAAERIYLNAKSAILLFLRPHFLATHSDK